MTEWTVNNKLNAWYQKQYHIKLPKQYETKSLLYVSPLYTPLELFSAGEQGAWYDPSDLTTMFQDTAGTNPVTGTGQSVARINDKSGRGNNATQATFTSQPIYGIEPFGGRRNLLTFTEQFDNAAWAKSGSTISADASTAPDGTTTADKIVETATTATHGVNPATFTFAATTAYTASVYVKAAERTWVYMQFSSAAFVSNTRAWFNLSDGTTSQVQNSTATITSVGNGWYRCTLSATSVAGGVSTTPLVMGASTGTGVSSYAGDGTSGILVWGAQLETSSTASAYQRVTDQYNVTEANVPSVSYLFFDGASDSLATPSINFTSTDKMTVFAGVRKLANAVGTIAELGAASGNGLVAVYGNSSNNYGVLSKGTLQATVVSPSGGTTPPITNIVTGIGDISGDITIIRVNGAQAATSSTDQGTGTYGNYPLYFGARGGSTLFFSGHLYSLVVRGAQSDASQLSSTEAWVASKTGVTI
jgi:hypothetical protein